MASSRLIHLLLLLSFCSYSSFGSSPQLPSIDQRSSIDPPTKSGCSISIRSCNELRPLILRTGDPPTFAMPDPKGMVRVPKNGQLRLACPGDSKHPNTLAISGTGETIAECDSGTSFTVVTSSGKVSVDFERLTCSHSPSNTARYRREGDQNCPSPYTPTEVGFILPSDGYFLRVMDGCFDKRFFDAIYTHFDLPPEISRSEQGCDRPEFSRGNFYGNLQVNHLYSIRAQRAVISEILGSNQLGDKYIKETGGLYLARGHLSARADFIHSPIQSATFNLINAAPQWQVFNVNNWRSLEKSLRTFAASSNRTLSVWTGSHGVASLPDVNGNQKPLALHRDEDGINHINVPAVFWKVVLDRQSGKSVGLVGVNNPYLDPVPKSLIFCTSVCDKLAWLRWSPCDVRKGFSYCCEVDELRKKIPSIPKFKTSGILT